MKYSSGILALVTASSMCGVASAQSFEYANPLSYRQNFSIQIEPPSVASGDRAEEASICPAGDRFVCVSSSWFNFAFPVIGRLAGQWEHNGFEYTIVGKDKLYLFDMERGVFHIESTQSGRKWLFLFSLSHGLLGFSTVADGERIVFLSDRELGFGAAADTKRELKPK